MYFALENITVDTKIPNRLRIILLNKKNNYLKVSIFAN